MMTDETDRHEGGFRDVSSNVDTLIRFQTFTEMQIILDFLRGHFFFFLLPSPPAAETEKP